MYIIFVLNNYYLKLLREALRITSDYINASLMTLSILLILHLLQQRNFILFNNVTLFYTNLFYYSFEI